MHKPLVRTLNASLVLVSSDRRLLSTGILLNDILVPGTPNTTGTAGMSNMYMMMAIWFAIALLLFVFRPRNNLGQQGKPANQVSTVVSVAIRYFGLLSRIRDATVKIHPALKFNR